ncbi:autotransporter outer membrane beta-barrel domain-containing protein [Pseudomonas putida]|nr:autotransporter outer membrane beta-barrel domain-containing protein [Pseudomonas putida]
MMPKTPSFKLRPLVRILKFAALAPLVLGSEYAMARTIIGDETIDATTPSDNYLVTGGSHLTANGAQTQHILTQDGGRLTLNGSTVTATGINVGVFLGSGSADISGSTITSETEGLSLGRQGSNGSTANVRDSTITGARSGVQISANSDLFLENTQVTGTNATSQGIQMFGGSVTARNSSIIGGTHGIRIRLDSALPDSGTVNLDGTHVEGSTGAAIQVGTGAGQGVSADIVVANGSTLTGGDGNVLKVASGSTGNMTVDNSHLVGNVVAEDGATANLTLQNHATLTGALENVASLTLASQGQWNMVEDDEVGDLVMDGGAVRFGEADAFHRLTVENLSGNGTFIMDTDFSTGQTDFLEVTGEAHGDHKLLVGSSGADPLTDGQIHVVQTAGGDASFSLLNGEVDLGTFSYDLIRDGDNWYLDASTRKISPGTQVVLGLFNAAPTVWYGELSSLRSRMGELRLNGGKGGAWMRSYGNKYNVSASSGTAYKQTQQGVSLGADAPLPIGDGHWLAGVLAGYSDSDLNLARGSSGQVDSYYLGAYTTWLDPKSGYYFDAVLKFNRLQNDATVNLSDGTRTKGDYDNHALGTSLEFGRHIALGDGWFAEPYTQWSGVTIQGKRYNLDNGMRADGDTAHSLLGKVGSTFGRNVELGEGRVIQPYVRVAYAHEFASDNAVRVNDNRFNNDLSGSRGELGAGVSVSLARSLQMHVDLDYSNGEQIEQPWGANVGLRYSW